ncbi:hypothetical protein HYX13_02725 [Candidatus Woesearchaeota archaeon]|nr:hypothetical protein [Candidatus Woesearchaeota archaeon]
MNSLKKMIGLAAIVTALSSASCSEEKLFHVESPRPSQEKNPPITQPSETADPDIEPPSSPSPEYIPPQQECRRSNCAADYLIDGILGRITQEIIQVAEMQEQWYTLRLYCMGGCFASQPPPTSPVPYGPDTWANQQCYLVNDYTFSQLTEDNPEAGGWFFDSEPAVYVPLNDCLPLPNNVQFMLLYADIPYYDGNPIPAYEGEIEFCLIPHGDVVLSE